MIGRGARGRARGCRRAKRRTAAAVHFNTYLGPLRKNCFSHQISIFITIYKKILPILLFFISSRAAKNTAKPSSIIFQMANRSRNPDDMILMPMRWLLLSFATTLLLGNAVESFQPTPQRPSSPDLWKSRSVTALREKRNPVLAEPEIKARLAEYLKTREENGADDAAKA